jgi:hypothetical protein
MERRVALARVAQLGASSPCSRWRWAAEYNPFGLYSRVFESPGCAPGGDEAACSREATGRVPAARGNDRPRVLIRRRTGDRLLHRPGCNGRHSGRHVPRPVRQTRRGRETICLPGVHARWNLRLRTRRQDVCRFARWDPHRFRRPEGALQGTLRTDAPGAEIAVSPDGKRLALTGGDAPIVVWDVPVGKKKPQLCPIPRREEATLPPHSPSPSLPLFAPRTVVPTTQPVERSAPLSGVISPCVCRHAVYNQG